MFTDKSLMLCDNTNFFGGNGAALIGDVIDLGTGGFERVAAGMPLALNVRIATGMTGGTSLLIYLATDSTLSGGNLASANTGILQSNTVPRADLTKGASLILPLASGSMVLYERYLQLAIVRTGTSTAGALHAFLSFEQDDWHAYKSARPKLT